MLFTQITFYLFFPSLISPSLLAVFDSNLFALIENCLWHMFKIVKAAAASSHKAELLCSAKRRERRPVLLIRYK